MKWYCRHSNAYGWEVRDSENQHRNLSGDMLDDYIAHRLKNENHARLIAAAPELLAALEETKMYLMAKARKHPAERNIVALIRVTIANATVG